MPMPPNGAANLYWENIGPLAAGQTVLITTSFEAAVGLDAMLNPMNCAATNRAKAAIVMGTTTILRSQTRANQRERW
ncbi:MAG: hypothetical protein H6645_07285 [Caldilineaceae bacterium]|nr:hypothetical protein [Caldilineaceae bacterium]